MPAQHGPHLAGGHIAQRLGDQAAVPAGIPRRRRGIQLPQNALRRLRVLHRRPGARPIPQPRQAVGAEAAAPFTHGRGAHVQLARDGTGPLPLGGPQHEARAVSAPPFGAAAPAPALQGLSIRRRDHERRSLIGHHHLLSGVPYHVTLYNSIMY